MNWEECVIKIEVKSTNLDFNSPLDNTNIISSSGSGFFIGDKQILTCYHVIQYAVSIEIIYNQTAGVPGIIKHIFPDDDLAIIEIDNKFEAIQILNFKNLSSNINNEPVYTIGFPGTNNIIISKGIISGFRKSLIQTDATLNSGNSGGPLVMLDIQTNEWVIIGINVSKLSGGNKEGTGFAVPSYRYTQLLDRLKQNESIIINKPSWEFDYQVIKQDSLRNFLFKDYKPENHNILVFLIKHKFGVMVSEINTNNYLHKHLKKNDILLSINNTQFDQWVTNSKLDINSINSINNLNGFIDINGFIKFDFYPDKISLHNLYYWFDINQEISITFFDSITKTIVTTPLKLEYHENNMINFYKLDNSEYYFIENNNLILSIFTKQHYENISCLNLKMTQIFKILNRYLYRRDLFTVYLSNINPEIYKDNKKFNKYPIGDIIVEINNKTFDNYDSFKLIVKDPIESIKTIENKIYFINN